MSDRITILTHSVGRLAKQWLADGTIQGYDDTKYYALRTEPAANIHELSTLLTHLERDPQSAVIRGHYRGDEHAAQVDPDFKAGAVRRIKTAFEDAPLHFVLIEIDDYEPLSGEPVLDPVACIDEFVAAHLPPEFHGVSYHWQLSSGAGHAKNSGKLKAHVWFWLAQAVNSDSLKAWAVSRALPIDTSVFNVVQFHYTAAPVAAGGVTIPVPVRSGFVDGMFGDEVQISIAQVQVAAEDVDGRALMALAPTLGWTLDQARGYLMECDANAGRDQWFRAIAAIHHETGGSEAGLDLCDAWSAAGTAYAGRKDVESCYRSFGRNGLEPITGKWLLKWRSECIARRRYSAAAEWKTKIGETADEFLLREKVCPQIAKDVVIGDFEREALAQLLCDKFRALGTKQSISVCRKMVTPVAPTRVEHDLPKWAEHWAYVTDKDQFFRIDSDEWLSMQSFNAKFNREMPMGEDGQPIQTAGWACLNQYGMPTVTRAMYLPSAGPDFVFEGVTCVNLYRPSGVPAPSATLSADGRAAVERVKRHIDMICGGRRNVGETLVAFLAHNVQQPGVKVRWAPLIKGIEGDGKSLIGTLLAVVMGTMNVRNVSPKVLGTDFNGWAEGAAVGVLEEIKLTGHNRHDVLNALKPLITNDRVPIHRKGMDEYNIVNTTNYIAFTNHNDALPLGDTDRRWWVVFTPFTTSAEMVAAIALLGQTPRDYFDALHGAIEQHPAELRRWLLDAAIPSWFNRNGSAPETEEKASMIALGITEEEETAREVIEQGAYGVSRDVLSSKCLVDAMALADISVSLATTAVAKLLNRLGYTRVPKKLRWDDRPHIVWVKGRVPSSIEVLKESLDKTLDKKAGVAEVVNLFA